MPTSVELRQNRADFIAKARKVYDQAETEKRSMTGEETESFNRLMGEADALRSQIETVERKEQLDHAEAELRATTGRRAAPAPGSTRAAGGALLTDDERKEMVRAWALQGTDLAPNNPDLNYRAAELGIRLPSRELSLRALSKGSAAAGGNATPTSMLSRIVEVMKYYNPIRQRATVLTTDSGTDLDYPKVDDTANDAAIVAEAGTITAATDPTFSKTTLKAWKYATTIVLVSVELLADMAVDPEALLARLLGKRMSRGQAAHMVTGNGTTQPQGIATAATAAVNLVTANPLTFDKIIDLIYSLDREYRTGAALWMHDETMAAAVKLKDTTNQYLWSPGLKEGDPDRIKGYPIEITNSLTSITSPGDNQPLILFGNTTENYAVRDVAGSTVLTRLNELYAATGQVGFVMLQRTDGRLIGPSTSLKSLNSYDS